MPRAHANLARRRFGQYTVMRRVDTGKPGAHWACRCSCGNVRNVRADNLLAGYAKSCGCKGSPRRRPTPQKAQPAVTRAASMDHEYTPPAQPCALADVFGYQPPPTTNQGKPCSND